MSVRLIESQRRTHEDSDRNSRQVVAFVLVMVVLLLVCTGVLTGAVSAASYGSIGGSGSLTVQVTDQQGRTQSGQIVTIRDDVTGEERTATTDQNGQVTFGDINQGGYTVVAGDKSTQANLNSASQQVSTQIDVSPPKSIEPHGIAFDLAARLGEARQMGATEVIRSAIYPNPPRLD